MNHASLADSIIAASRHAPSALGIHFRRAIRAHGVEPIPMGVGDVKTGAPGTYRQVGGSCPSTCPMLAGGCYAKGGNVGLAQRRAPSDIDGAVASAMAAVVWAWRLGLPAARLHVSGDLGQTDAEVAAYVAGLVAGMGALRDALPELRDRVIAWTYTHHVSLRPDGALSALRDDLHAAGIYVRLSDVAGEGGAIVAPFASVAEVRTATGARLAKCPAQLRSVTCAECRLCWERPDVGVVFDPHGGARRQAERAGASAMVTL